jgi:DNA transformation protein
MEIDSNEAMRDVAVARLTPFGPVAARAMFGGFGLYIDGVMFALIARGRLWFKTDDANRPDYEAVGAEPFTYQGRNKPVIMSYSEIVAAVFDDPERLMAWADKAHAAARRAKSKKRKRR